MFFFVFFFFLLFWLPDAEEGEEALGADAFGAGALGAGAPRLAQMSFKLFALSQLKPVWAPQGPQLGSCT